MKKTLSIILIALLLICFETSTAEETTQSLYGEWYLHSIEYEGQSINASDSTMLSTIVFGDNGTVLVEVTTNGEKTTGIGSCITYSNKLKIVLSDTSQMDGHYDEESK